MRKEMFCVSSSAIVFRGVTSSVVKGWVGATVTATRICRWTRVSLTWRRAGFVHKESKTRKLNPKRRLSWCRRQDFCNSENWVIELQS
ncbi:unnamed protein product [Linum trigynum]|uniref:Secreted protein n=1 Tax=Linum trigynum TaxID=586398 RepID=A0AAV2FD55_9ROSI